MLPKLKFTLEMELVLITITTVLCSILFIKLLYKLQYILIWRVNCWFCNQNFWLKYVNRNSWTCPKCEQYNGFTKDGDYNKTLVNTSDQSIKSPKVFQKSPPRNGLCKMCNINQQLKVVQLANFVPMNENKFDEEVESYKSQLEKAYKLCSPCRKVLQMKLHREKETLLGKKLLENRTPDKKQRKQEKKSQVLKAIINNTSMFIAGVLVLFVSMECYVVIMNHKNVPCYISNVKQIALGIIDRIVSIIKMKMILTFPSIEKYLHYFNELHLMGKVSELHSLADAEGYFTLTQKALGGFVCLIQIIGHIWNINKLKYTIVIDLLWSVFVITSILHHPQSLDPLYVSLIKLTSTLSVLFVYMKMKNSNRVPKKVMTSMRMKNFNNGTLTSLIDEEDNLSLDTDDDVSLSKFGLHNFTDSSHETISPQNLQNGRSFTPRSDSLWSKPKLNSTFCVNSVTCNSPSSISDNVFIKPSFNKYQKLTKDDSDSDLDESISTLCIGSPKKNKHGNPMFSLRKFNATPCFVAPTPLNRTRPLISPSKLGHSTSWVAGGYWGSEGERPMFNIDGSRSSSQSSGFESQASSLNQRNIFSQPPSREESVCGEPMAVDNLRCNNPTSFSNYQTPLNFSRVSSPVFPQMQYNSHVHIPQPRLAQHNMNMVSTKIFPQQQIYVPNNTFKTPGGSGLIKLPQVNSFPQ
ncbi:unnamed protein product [Chilo suppressalis]|uniref:Ima1 N-terminal domain-containing protein n=1 Tax=Chilo suppressalis TaxID=168631 RepID=A0ABN8BGZ4_CHISP|nr:hypothetical protein evm_012110 [Chilo suppressalis]CAH0406297.1 unnamed protein product [Chilo suppressalis]